MAVFIIIIRNNIYYVSKMQSFVLKLAVYMGTTMLEIVMEDGRVYRSTYSDAAYTYVYLPWRISFYAITKINTTINTTLTHKDTEYILQHLNKFQQTSGDHKGTHYNQLAVGQTFNTWYR
jgi:hypothetical protein